MNLNIELNDITSDLLQQFISNDMNSPVKQLMRDADEYYNVRNVLITNRRKMMMLYNESDDPYIKEDYSKANNKAKHSYLQELINQCTNFLVGKPIKIDYKKAFDKVGGIVEVEEVEETTNPITGQVFASSTTKVETSEQADMDKDLIDNELYRNNNFTGFIQENIKQVQLYGKSYMRIVVDSEGNKKFVTYNPKEIIMFYNEFDEPVLCIRYFTKPELVLNSKTKKKELQNVMYAEVYDKQSKDTWKYGATKKGIWEKVGNRELVYANKITYGQVNSNNQVEPKDGEEEQASANIQIKVEPIEIPVFPIIEWKFNDECLPTLINIKDFIDLQDMNLSDLANNVEDIQDAIWILENYTGQNLKEFMEDLKVKKSIKVGTGGNARSETIEIPIQAREKLYELCRKNIYKFGFGIDFQERDSLGNVSGVALKWSYAPLEQKSNAIETNGQEALNNFFNILFMLMGLPYDSNDLEFIFDRTMISNEQEQTSTVMSASSQLSQKTILDNLPMVKDTEDELERLEGENEYEPVIPKETDDAGEEDEEEDDTGDEDASIIPADPTAGE